MILLCAGLVPSRILCVLFPNSLFTGWAGCTLVFAPRRNNWAPYQVDTVSITQHKPTSMLTMTVTRSSSILTFS